MPKVQYEDFDDDALDRVPNLERIPRKPREEQKPAKDKVKKPKRQKPELDDDLIYFSRNPKYSTRD